MIKQLHAVPYEVVRHLGSESFEAVLPFDRVREVLPILGEYFGTPLKPSAQSPTSEVKEIAVSCGGIREEQTLYYSEHKGKFEFATLWPWKDGDHVTLKVLTRPPAFSTGLALDGKQKAKEKIEKIQTPVIEILILGPQMQWTGNILKILKEDGFKPRAVYSGSSLGELFQRREYAPQAVLVYLSRCNWPGPEVVPQIKGHWPETRLLVYAEDDMPWRLSLDSIRDADLFHRGHEDWIQLGAVIKKTLQQRYDPLPMKKF